jgi:phage repressor protein C with HTH and peptisase S24 domain
MFKVAVNDPCNTVLNAPFTIAGVRNPIDLALELAEAKGMNQSDFARLIEETPQAITNWKARGMPPKHLAKVANALGVSIEFLVGSQVPNKPAGAFAGSPPEPPLSYAGSAKTSRRMGVVGQVQIGADGGFDGSCLDAPGANYGTIEVYGAHEDAFAIRVLGDQLYPAIRHGQCLVVEPSSPPVQGEQVILHMRSGRLLIRELFADRPDSVTVLALNNPASRETFMREDILRIVPIVALIPASKWRAP